MMKKIPKILSTVLFVGLIAAIPASTQILADAATQTDSNSNLQWLILINRLELSQEQMVGLQGILNDLLDAKAQSEDLAAQFESTMVAFNGTSEELDALIADYREQQQSLAESLRESMDTSLDHIRDLLSINQGLVLQEVLPQLMGGSALGANQRLTMRAQLMSSEAASSEQEADADGSTAGAVGMMQRRAASIASNQALGERIGRATSGSARGTVMQRMQQQDDTQAMAPVRDRIQARVDELQNRLPDAVRERRSSSADVPPRSESAAGRTQRLQAMTRVGSGNLFDLVQQIADALELKLEAVE